jgi:hypothetical protein
MHQIEDKPRGEVLRTPGLAGEMKIPSGEEGIVGV